MRDKSKKDRKEKFLSKSQEVLYQKEFKRANNVYNRLSQKGTQ
ncbi:MULTISPECIES: YfhE family protein [unclassified Virgibacillus]|nr:YfhE family protein [Virgibacillus sp. LDC-1]